MRTEKDNRSRKRCNHCSVTALFHNSVNDRDGETTKECGQSSHSHIRNVIFCVAVADILEVELAIKSNKPASEAEKEFGEGRVYVEIVFSCDIVGGEFPKMNFVESRIGNGKIGTRRTDASHTNTT